jgi:hypothetical protein
MALTKERKVYLGLLAAGLAALTVDRLTGGPEKARAYDESAYVVPRAGGPAVAPAKSPQSSEWTGGGALATRLQELTDRDPGREGSGGRDLFRVPTAWATAPANPSPTTAPVANPAGSPAEFEKAHRLTAVILSERQSHAIIDGRMIKPGQTLDGFTLLTVTQDAAIFRSRLGTAVLKPEIKPQQP